LLGGRLTSMANTLARRMKQISLLGAPNRETLVLFPFTRFMHLASSRLTSGQIASRDG
jgi:hypothetical protein